MPDSGPILSGKPMPMDFVTAMNRARVDEILSRFKRTNTELLSFYQVTNLIKPRNECYRGIHPIKVSDIIGSECRYHDFSPAFFPKNPELQRRWESIERANLDNIDLPPISVFKLGGKYFVRDGNHRVSVAKALGIAFIDAEIVELDSAIKLHSGMTEQQIIAKLCEYERERFIEQYHPQDYLPMDEIVFTSVGGYPELVQHILVHKYYINMDKDYEVTFEEAARSWYENIYKPICGSIGREHMRLHFPGRTKADLYMWVVRHWDDLKKADPGVTIDEAGHDYEKKHGKGMLRRWIARIRGRSGKT